ncbi:hypothetical protein JMA_04180 [Jeotgalibacillus malaysiensis]|uniref:Uncharacterized protein n=1 Tax=Jeotgalibacillus malaysiensis TaxID=1508404 RepID=A0A0B5AH61_9BACL|nr:hypothetical protein JMA_04180 [Jeotgalibacillus malaysiensis]
MSLMESDGQMKEFIPPADGKTGKFRILMEYFSGLKEKGPD